MPEPVFEVARANLFESAQTEAERRQHVRHPEAVRKLPKHIGSRLAHDLLLSGLTPEEARQETIQMWCQQAITEFKSLCQRLHGRSRHSEVRVLCREDISGFGILVKLAVHSGALTVTVSLSKSLSLMRSFKIKLKPSVQVRQKAILARVPGLRERKGMLESDVIAV